jgi:hypothetical protein
MQLRKNLFLKLLCVAVFLCISNSARAMLIGDTVTCSSAFTTCSPTSAVVAGGAEFQFNSGLFVVDIADNIGDPFIKISSLSSFTFGANGTITIGDIDDSGGNIVGITSVSASAGISGIDASDISFTAHTVSFNLANSVWTSNQGLTVQLAVRPAAVPEPGSLALVALALAGIGFSRRKRE